jgi:hypothetical protein
MKIIRKNLGRKELIGMRATGWAGAVSQPACDNSRRSMSTPRTANPPLESGWFSKWTLRLLREGMGMKLRCCGDDCEIGESLLINRGKIASVTCAFVWQIRGYRRSDEHIGKKAVVGVGKQYRQRPLAYLVANQAGSFPFPEIVARRGTDGGDQGPKQLVGTKVATCESQSE